MYKDILVVWGVITFLLPQAVIAVALNSSGDTNETVHLENISELISLNDFANAKFVIIKNCSFAQVLPDDAFNSFAKLKNLTIVASNLSEVKKWTRIDLENLLQFDLHENKIWQIEFGAFASFPNLVALDLSHNRIARINNETFYGINQVEWIDLSANALDQIDEFTFTELLRLKSLNLRQNKIQYLDVFALTTNTLLEHLDLSENQLKTIDDHLLYNLLNLKCLNLSGNALRFIAAKTFAENSALVDLDLSRNRIVDLHDEALIGLRNLEFLNLKQNQVSELSSSLLADLKALKCLDASSNLLSSLVDDQFSHMKSLKMLHLTSNLIQKASNHSFAGLPNLECVDLSLNWLRDGHFVHDLTALKMLNLSFNRFEAINATLLRGIEYVELVGNYWRCSWLIPELVNRRLSPGIHFVANTTSRKSVYDEIDCYAESNDTAPPHGTSLRTTVLPKHHSLRHIVVLRENSAPSKCEESKNIEQSFTINIYQRSFTRMVGDNFTFTNSLIWVAVGMIILIILVHLGKYLANDWNKVGARPALSGHCCAEESFLKRPTEELKTRS